MAKKRDRRAASTSDRQKPRVQSPKNEDEDQLTHSSSNRKLVLIFVFFFIVSTAVSVLVYRIKFSATPVKLPDSYVHRRALVKPDISYQEILAENSRASENGSQRQYTYPVLAYITPWNSRGYELAKRFNSKFTHLSPVWYDLKSQGTTLVLEGRHNADRGWMSDLRVHGDALVLPRVVLEAFPKELLRKKKLRDKAINLIVTECKEMDYDGIVLESWSRWAAYGVLHDPELRVMALGFVEQLGHALHSVSSQRSSKQHLELIYVIGPPRSEKLQPYDFGAGDLQGLSDAVDGYSLMTYDFSGPQSPGPNAPLEWIRSVLQLLLGNPRRSVLAPKIFLGINFYGNDFILSEGDGGGAITGGNYLSLLEKHKPVLQWNQKSGEHLFFYMDDSHIKHVVFYPSLMSISLRLEEARLSGTGISIWEIGQGLDYFFDLL